MRLFFWGDYLTLPIYIYPYRLAADELWFSARIVSLKLLSLSILFRHGNSMHSL